MDENRVRKYDEIVTTVLQNVLVERERVGKIVLFGFDPKIYSHRLYYHVAVIASAINQENIYLGMGVVDYVKFVCTHWQMRKVLRRFGNYWHSEDVDPMKLSSVHSVMHHVKEYYGIGETTCGNIVKEFYEKEV